MERHVMVGEEDYELLGACLNRLRSRSLPAFRSSGKKNRRDRLKINSKLSLISPLINADAGNEIILRP
jgi:hypothetical protein